MRTNIEIDEQIMQAALRASGARTKREAVELGLRALIRLHAQGKARQLRGKIDWDGDLDAQRTDRPRTIR
jgi:Arc/MetJ family transcription regulator